MKRITALITAIGMVVMMPFTDSILAGETLVRTAIKSEGFQSGVQGWRIARDGDAEFNNVLVRGEFSNGVAGERHIEIDSTDKNRIKFFSANAGWDYGFLEVEDGSDFASLKMQPPTNNVATTPFFSLNFDAVGTDTASLAAEMIVLQNPGAGNTLEVVGGEIAANGASWTNLSLAGTWVAQGGQTPQYYVDPVKNVHIRGRVTGGGAALIGTLPVGARPSALHDIALKSNNDAGTISWVQIATNGQISVVGNVAAAQVWLTLALNFSTL